MKRSGTEDRVRLKHELPALGLPMGAEGILFSVWPSGLTMYEIQFLDKGYGCRVLLPAHHVELEYVATAREVTP